MKPLSQPAAPAATPPTAPTVPAEQRSDAVAALALHFAESLDLPVVLDQVAQQVATSFNGVCRVRFAPLHRPADRRRVVAGPGDAAQSPDGTSVDATYAALLARLSEHDACNAGASWEAHQPGSCSAALLFAPLVARGARIGAIDVVIPAAECCDVAAHQRMLRAIAAHAALAIDTADRFARPDRSTAGNAQQPAQTDASALLALIAHDLRGPLTALSSSIQMLVRATKQPDSAAHQQITRLTELAEVAVAQLETQISALTPRAGTQRQSGGSAGEPVDLVQLAHLMANFYQQTTARQRFIVVADVAELYCRCPRSHAERVLGNLLVNAIKYGSAGSDIRIIVNREEDLIGAWATLSVQNDGIGIPAQDLTHLTNPGFRATNVGPIPGTGFGLASVREVVEQYGGTFAVQSTVGAATTVQIRLPLSGQQHQNPVHAAYAHA